MGRERKKEIPDCFESKIKEGGERGVAIREIVENKMKVDHRKTYSDTIVAIILEYGEIKQPKRRS